ncbi:hypothetical protein [Prevotella fusca]|uniref:Uncharacterized protein n=1 Tax=Prevotella fusca JCM 17724 TaxID=1236517 RepID=A0ABX7Y1H3_9BACT|nr:hypothetical protein [Prevotella fusca]QUB87576.1 hypothetical protein J5A51_09025 [Prevotella fusca JCM 17724]
MKKNIEKSVLDKKGEEIERATLDNDVQELTKEEVLERFKQATERRQLPKKSWLDFRVF